MRHAAWLAVFVAGCVDNRTTSVGEDGGTANDMNLVVDGATSRDGGIKKGDMASDAGAVSLDGGGGDAGAVVDFWMSLDGGDAGGVVDFWMSLDGGDGGIDCTAVAPTTPVRQLFGQWYLNANFQGSTNFDDYLYPFSDKGSSGTTPWPGTFNNGARTLMIASGYYVSLQFNTGSWPLGSVGGYIVSDSAFGNAVSYMTITECPGDFRSNMIDDKCELGPTGAGGLYWQMGTTSNFRCVLQQNKTYYLNIVSADPNALSTSLCMNSSCGILIASNF